MITLLSEYGNSDPYLPIVQARLLQAAPKATLCDISHAIEPGNFWQAAFVLGHSYHHFPKGTVHLVLVGEIPDNERWLAVLHDGHYFVCADNGLLPLALPHFNPYAAIALAPHADHHPLFPAKGLMVQAAARLSQGRELEKLGSSTREWRTHTAQQPVARADYILGAVVYIDNFGNLISNISRSFFETHVQDQRFEIVIPRNPMRIKRVYPVYHQLSAGSIMALFNSLGYLEIALSAARGKNYNGANTMLGLAVDSEIRINIIS